MNKLLTALICFLTVTICSAQTAAEINKKAKDFAHKKDLQNAVALWKQGAEMGDGEAQFSYALCFMQGIHVEKDAKVGMEWLQKAAASGFKEAQYRLAIAYSMGTGVEADNEKSFYWNLKCAAQNDPDCIYNVVVSYESGSGAEKRIDSMLMWESKLATLTVTPEMLAKDKIAAAGASLGNRYRAGLLVEKDTITSYMWYLIYNENKNNLSPDDQKKNIASIQAMEKKMTAEQKHIALIDAQNALRRKLINMENLYVEGK